MKTLKSKVLELGVNALLSRDQMRNVKGGYKSVPCYCGEERTKDVECNTVSECACACGALCGVSC
jgi:hypothetical protein